MFDDCLFIYKEALERGGKRPVDEMSTKSGKIVDVTVEFALI